MPLAGKYGSRRPRLLDTGLDEYCYWFRVTDVIVTAAWAEYTPPEIELHAANESAQFCNIYA